MMATPAMDPLRRSLLLLLLLASAATASNPPAPRRHLFGLHFPSWLSLKCLDPLPPPPAFPNPRLAKAHAALQSWKQSIDSDPHGFTSNWVGHDVCSYSGVFCDPAPDDPSATVVAGVDLNGADISGLLPPNLGDLKDAAVIHLNSNRFRGTLPDISCMPFLHELDLSNNRLAGPFPSAVLLLPSLKYLDLRFNSLSGPLPPQLFDMDLDALFLNNNLFSSVLPGNIGKSKVSAMVLANNLFVGCIPMSIGGMRKRLNELVMSNNRFSGCIPKEIGRLKNLAVLDLSSNLLHGDLPRSMDGLRDVEVLDVGVNRFTGAVPEGVCELPKLSNLTLAWNYFGGERGEAPPCRAAKRSGVVVDDRSNCFVGEPLQRKLGDCLPVVSHPVRCDRSLCATLL